MKTFLKQTLLLTGILVLAALSSSQAPIDNSPLAAEPAIEWLSWGEAMDKMATEPKKIFIDVYTDWCGWCKRMDASTFTDPAVIQLMNEHFYAVKLDAEQEESIEYDNHTFVYRPDAGRRGVHELAYALLDGKMSYPSFVYLDEVRQRISISPGYKDAAGMQVELRYIGADHFKSQTYDAFRESQGK